jgi:Uma2 family endonuclease
MSQPAHAIEPQPEPPATGGPLVLHLTPELAADDDWLLALSSRNDLRLERTAEGDLEIMPPTGFTTGNRNMKLSARLGSWTEQDGRGLACDSSTGFRLPNGAVRSPDAAWVRRERVRAVRPEAREKYLPLCPDFAIELASTSDSMAHLHAKMDEYLANGCQLAWLLMPARREAHVYRPGHPVETHGGDETLSADPILPGFNLDLEVVWESEP